MKNIEDILSKGKWHFILVHGLLRFGITFFVLMIFWDYFANGEFLTERFLRHIILGIFSGLTWSAIMWFYFNKKAGNQTQ
jgi:hypothetical protein